MSRLILIFALIGVNLSAYTKHGTIYTTDGSFADVKAAVRKSSPGDTVNLPAGTFDNYGKGVIEVNKPITIAGAGRTSTILNGIKGSPIIFRVSAAATIRGFTFNGGGSQTIVFSVTGKEGTNIGARFTDLKINFAGGLGSRMFLIDRVYALADNCEFIGGSGRNEYIFMRGPKDAWDHPADPGSANLFYFEDCVFGGSGYPDANACAKMVFRFNRINAKSKFDGHGFASNGDPTRGVRLIEAYFNTWIHPASSWAAMEWRGGGLYCFGNRSFYKAGNWPNLYLREYGVQAAWSNFKGVFQTPYNYPVPDQIGAGPGTVVVNGHGTQVGGAEPAYLWNNAKASASTPVDWTPTWKNGTSVSYTTNGAAHGIGETTINLAKAGARLSAGNWIAIAGDNNRYRLASSSTKSSTTFVIDAPGLLQAIPANATTITAGPNTNYQGQTGNPAAKFTTDSGIIVANRDFFWGAYGSSSFTGASGIGTGTKAQMLAITGTTVGVGFWVTDEADWDSTTPGVPDGQLYTWNGSAWVLKYTPYPYPHPLRKG